MKSESQLRAKFQSFQNSGHVTSMIKLLGRNHPKQNTVTTKPCIKGQNELITFLISNTSDYFATLQTPLTHLLPATTPSIFGSTAQRGQQRWKVGLRGGGVHTFTLRLLRSDLTPLAHSATSTSRVA